MAKTLALVFGIVFVLIGLLGFVSNPLVGANGLFMTNGLHDIVHILFGIILIWASRGGQASSVSWLKILGVVYLVLAVLGFLLAPSGPSLLGLVTVNMADHWLHVVLGVVLLAAAFMSNSSSSQQPGAMA
ncbi:MAG TPA: DUF4383 domain-containing protein [Candidatus Paceibacterota bacterium]|nr:DUF4383 domain-containing protein [Candidatus Paceibacterota bacterium]